MSTSASPPITLEGWFSACTALRVDRERWRARSDSARAEALASARETLDSLLAPRADGWSMLVSLANSTSDVLLMHLRPSLEELLSVRQQLAREPLWECLIPEFAFVSVIEVAFYGLSVELEGEARARGGEVGDAAYNEAVAARLPVERAAPHVQRRLRPVLPPDMPYTCFYPMSRRRSAPHNWYTLPLAEREQLMRAHGETGRRYRGRLAQIITGATGFDSWEWGVTIFAHDPLTIRQVVTDMRYDTASAEYATFGPFHLGLRTTPVSWLAVLR